MKKILTAIITISILITTAITPQTITVADVCPTEVTIKLDRIVDFGDYFWFHDFNESIDGWILIYLDDKDNEVEILFNPEIEIVTYNGYEANIWTMLNEINNSRGRSGTITLSDPTQSGVYQKIEVESPYIFVVERIEDNDMMQVAFNGGMISPYKRGMLTYTHCTSIKTMDGQPLENIKEGDVWEVFKHPYLRDEEDPYIYVNNILTEKIIGIVTDEDISRASYNPNSWNWYEPGPCFLINSNWYDLSYSVYMPRDISLDSAGTFYIDSYGKIAAFLPAVDVIYISEWRATSQVVTEALVKAYEPRLLIVALYGADDKLKRIQTSSKTSVITYDGYKTIDSIYTKVVDGDYIKAFLWESLDSMKSVGSMERLDHKE